MKKVILSIVAAVVFAMAVLPFAVFAEGGGDVAAVKKAEKLEITQNPVERTFPRGGDIVYSLDTKGEAKFAWSLIVNNVAYDLTSNTGVEQAKKIAENPSDKNAAQEVIGADSKTLRLKGFWFAKEANAQVVCTVTSKDGGGEEVVGPVSMRFIDAVDIDSLQPPEITMAANVFARENTVIKLTCTVQDPEGVTYDNYEFKWFVLENGQAKELEGEEEMVLIVDQGLGRREYKCRVTAVISATKIEHETLWTPVEIYVPSVSVSYSTKNVTLKAGKTVEIEADYEVKRPSDEGKVSFQWYKSDQPDGIYKPVEGATSAALELKGTGEEGEAYYFCVVANEPYYQNREGDLEGTRYESVFDAENVVKVVNKGSSGGLKLNLTAIILILLAVIAVILLVALIVLIVVLAKRKK